MRLVPLLAALAALSAGAQTPTYRVYPVPVESPNHTTPLPPADARVLLAEPADATASPFGWLDTDGIVGHEGTQSAGNNVDAFFDDNGNTLPDAGERADGGASLAFDFSVDLTDPHATPDALVTNAFYWANVFHDVTYRHGFTEAAGNYQVNNYGRGGAGNDAIRMRVVAGNGATMASPPDGSAPLATIGSYVPNRPSSLDALVMVHELAHGLTNRLTGGPSTASCLQNAEQPGEGWSDFYGLAMTMRTDHSGADGRDIGNWIGGGAPGQPSQIRPAPYSTSFAINDYTYADTPSGTVPHGIGFVWATTLWEMYWELVDEAGFDPDLYDGDGRAGNQMAFSLVTTGLKLQPCLPGFVDARDAILMADQVLYGGDNNRRLWAAFARRGLGWSASQGSSMTNADNVAAFDEPPITPADPETPIGRFALAAPEPNPISTAARIRFEIETAGEARLSLFDAQGREVAVLVRGEQPAGRHEATLDASKLAAGVYVLQLRAGGREIARRVAIAPP